MKLINLLCFLALCMMIGINVEAKTTAKKKSKIYLKLVEAYSQKKLPGRQGSAPPMAGDHFIVIWESTSYPETFFWRGESGWLSCNIQKAHKITNRDHNAPRGMDYRLENLDPDQIHKGDTLELSPVTGGKFPIPAEIPGNAKNTLFFKTGGSGWLSFPVKNITKKPDVSMP